MMRVTECGSSLFPSSPFQRLFTTSRKRIGTIKVSIPNLPKPNVKRANLSARKKERIKLPSYTDAGGGKKMYHISDFLSHPSGIEAILNTRALQNFKCIDPNIYRCTLPRIQLLNFEVCPLLDLRVTPTNEDCIVELLSCKFEGSEVVERQNDHFSGTLSDLAEILLIFSVPGWLSNARASMRNYITWDTNDSEIFLDFDVNLNVTLEVYTQPFTLLPISAVEAPGNLMIQALVDRLVPLLLKQLLQDYDNWVQQQLAYLP